MSAQAPSQHDIEADLLQVGMRIRKSVAEGYQTQTKKFTPRPFFNAAKLSPETQAALMGQGQGQDNTMTDDTVQMAASQNLTTSTFCGISLSFLSNYPGGDDWAQEQQLWTYSTSSKRGYEVDTSDDSDGGSISTPDCWEPQTPNLMADVGLGCGMPNDYFAIDMNAVGDGMVINGGEQARQAFMGRKLAVPKSRARTPFQLSVQPQQQQVFPMAPAVDATNPFASFGVMPLQPEPQPQAIPTLGAGNNGSHGHRRIMSCGMEAAMDFGEASFLQRREDVEMDCS
jgi:hypothetical protein